AKATGTPIPLLGRIAAGAPVLATEQVEDYVAVPADFTSSGDHFALRVTGDSMVEAGILDGDIVAALLPGPGEDEATVKRLGHDGPRVMLIPENPSMSPFEMIGGRIA